MTDELYETLPGNGWLTRGEATLLLRYAAMTTGDLLEVGCYQGRSTVALASLGRMVHVVDPFEGFCTEDPFGLITKRAFLGNMRDRKITNFNLWQLRVEAWVPRPCGFAHLDGDHSRQGTIDQITQAVRCGVKAICVHDVNDTGEGAAIKDVCLKMLGPWAAREGRMAAWIL